MVIAGIVLGWVGIAGVAAIIALGALVTAGTTDARQRRACAAERAAVESATEAYRAQTGAYPTQTSDLVGTFLRESPEHFTVSGSTVTGSGPCA